MTTINRFNILYQNDSESDDIDGRKWKSVGGNGKQKSTVKKKIVQKENKNKKKILCHNIITHGECGYGSKCLYAHSLEEQQIEPNRKKAYEILESNTDLSYINLQQDLILYKCFLGLTKMCEKDKCTGGYNCKYGVCGYKKYCICQRDLNYGDCNDKCNCIHLTKRKMKPYYNYHIQDTTESIASSQIQGTLLSVDFFKSSYSDNCDYEEILSDISDNSSIDGCSDDEFNRSIFCEYD